MSKMMPLLHGIQWILRWTENTLLQSKVWVV